MSQTLAQQSLIDAIVHVLAADMRIESAWLSGSLGRGGGDAFSDVDVTVVAREETFDDALRHYAHDSSSITVVVHSQVVHGRVVSNVTEDWQRFDLTFVKPAEFAAMPLGAVEPLFNRGTPERVAAPAPPYRPSAQRILQLANEFIRVIGLAPVGIGRAEYLVALDGIGLLRRMTLDLMLEKNGIGPAARGGALHLNNMLTPEQRRLMEGLPPVAATRDSILAVEQALARIFLPLAKELTAETGAPWPTAFENATRRHLMAALNLDI